MTASGQAGRILRDQRHRADAARGGRAGDLAAHRAQRERALRVSSLHLGHEVEGDRRHGQHPAVRAEQPAHPVQSLHRVAEQLPQRHDQHVAHRVPAELGLPGEAVLDDPAPGGAPGIVAAQRRERHPQVTGRQDTVLAAQPAAGAPVVGHGHDRAQLAGHPAQRRQRGEQAVAAAERRDLGVQRPDGGNHAHVSLAGAGRAGAGRAGGSRASRHSRPRSRWTTWTAGPLALSWPAISSATATLRCLPPVHPIASVTNRLPSRS